MRNFFLYTKLGYFLWLISITASVWGIIAIWHPEWFIHLFSGSAMVGALMAVSDKKRKNWFIPPRETRWKKRYCYCLAGTRQATTDGYCGNCGNIL